jgi:hypothetical protein
VKQNLAGLLLVPTLFLMGCENDPFRNAGKCGMPGEYKTVESELAVCAGLEGQYKFYFEGPHFEAIYLLGKVEHEYLTFDNEEPFLRLAEQRGYKDLTWRTDWVISNDEIARFANGDKRWDGLIEANSIYSSLKTEFDAAQKYRFQMLKEFRNGKVSRQIAFEAQQDALAIADKRDVAMNQYLAKLAVLKAEIRNKYSVSSPLESMMFVIAKQHNL